MINVLFFADLHGKETYFNSVKNKSKKADIIVCAGDFTVMERNMSEIMTNLNELNKPVLVIHGNHEDPDAVKELCSLHNNLIFLHKGMHVVDNVVFMGYGGDGFSREDKTFEKVAKKFFGPNSRDKRRKILITHGPPYGTEIDKIGGSHKGNESYRKFIDEEKPHIVVAGHLHETAGKHQRIGHTLILNPGPKGVLVRV